MTEWAYHILAKLVRCFPFTGQGRRRLVVEGEAFLQRLPGLAERLEPENPGMHTSDTVDYDVVLDGEITLEVDGGKSRVLKQGDIAVRYGTRHAWQNHSNKPATLLFVLIGAKRA